MMSKKDKIIPKPITGGVAKTPVVMQLEALECGAACLTMVLAYYGKWIPLEQVRKDCGVSRDGSNAKNILLAARNYGLEARGYKLEPEVLKNSGHFPCIVHWEFNHFIVVNGFRHGKVYINDPARGELALSEDRFDEGFTGIAIMLEPTDEFVPEGEPKSVLGYARKRLMGAGAAVAFVVITTVISSILGIISPGFTRIFMDRLLPGVNPGWVNIFFVAFIMFTLLQILVTGLTSIYSLRVNGKMAAVGNSTYLWKVLHLPMEFFSQRMSGDVLQRMGTNAGIAETIIDVVAPLAINAGMMIFYLVVMIRYSVPLTFLGIASSIVNMLVASLISKKRINITRVSMRDSGKLYGLTVGGIEMIETIKASGAEDGFFQKWAGYQANVNSASIKEMKLSNYLGIIPQVVSLLVNTAIITGGVYLSMNGNFTIGKIMAFQGFLAGFMEPVSSLIGSGQTMLELRTQMERVEDVMEYPEDDVFTSENIESEESLSKLRGNIELKHVTFGYSRLADPLIEDFNMSIKPGSKVAFVGETGCGKSTLSKLISGLYSPWEGEILFDGKRAGEIDRSVFTSSVAVVDQNIIMFEDTISENIRMWDSSIQDFEVILGARDASIHNDIMQRPGGYNYKILEGGKDFSGGQKQRLEIARVLAQDPTILILDEATSALDARTEYDVVKAIKDRGITCIVIAHRLSTIRDCDEIVVLKNGKVVERGTHDSLYKSGGYYTELVTNE